MNRYMQKSQRQYNKILLPEKTKKKLKRETAPTTARFLLSEPFKSTLSRLQAVALY